MSDIKIGSKLIGTNQPVFIIAEAGINHNGSLGLAKKLIDAAVESGADAVKFQTFKAENLVTEKVEMAEYQKKNTGKQESQLDMLKGLELSYDELKELKDHCDKKGIVFFSTPHTEDAIDFLEDLMPVFKIGSGDLNNLPYLEKIAKKQKPIILSTGMGTLEEVKEAVNIIKKHNDQLILLHCTTNYPCPKQDVNLKVLETLKKETGCIIGYSDHTEGIEIPIMANLLGATVIEKHFTLDKNMEGPDHPASLDPAELKEMVSAIRGGRKMEVPDEIMGDGVKKPTKEEKETAKVTRKSIVAKVDIPKGKIIEKGMIIIKRPGTGIPPEKIEEIVGKRAKKGIKKDSLVKEEYVKGGLSYDETDKKLGSRINLHDTLAEKDIDPWILEIVKVKPGEKVLDVGCGNGKQVLSFGGVMKNQGGIIATDIAQDLLDEAKERTEEKGITNVKFMNHSMDDAYPFEDEEFDLINSCFAIYYVTDAKKLIKVFVRLLKKKGRVFIAGPTPNNTEEFWKLHEKVIGKPIDKKALIRRARIHEEFILLVKRYFSDVKVEVFENAMHFKTTEQLMDYYMSSLLFKEAYSSDEEKEKIIMRMKEEVDKVIEEKGEYVINKEVYGIIGYK